MLTFGIIKLLSHAVVAIESFSVKSTADAVERTHVSAGFCVSMAHSSGKTHRLLNNSTTKSKSCSSGERQFAQCASVGAKTRSGEKALNLKTRAFEGEELRSCKPVSVLCTLAGVCMAVFLTLALSGCTLVLESEAPALEKAQLTAPTISENGVLKVGVNTSQSPLAGMGASKIIGIDVDIAAALADSLGLKLQIVDTGSTPSKSLSNGDVDVAFGVDKSDAPSGVKLTDAYLPTAVVYFKKAGASSAALTSESSPKIGVQGSSKSAWSASNSFGTNNLVSSSDLAGAFQSLASGTVDYVAADAVIGMYAANKANVNVEIAALGSELSGYCVAMTETNTALVSEISTALANLVSDGTIATIQSKWLGTEIDIASATKVGNSGTTSSSDISSISSSTSGLSASGTTATDANSVTDQSGY